MVIIIAALGCADESIPDVAFVEIANQILRGGLRKTPLWTT